LEFKTSLSDSRRIIETIAAMATRGGGTIVIGVRDDGSVVGANLGPGEQERVVQQVLANTDPRVYVSLDTPVVDGKPLLRITVPPGDGPHLAFGRAFHRLGKATVAMSRDEYERRLLDRLREAGGFERRLAEGVDASGLDAAAARQWFERARGRLEPGMKGEGALELVERLHLARAGHLTVGGVLLFATWPQGPFPQAVIRARVERGALVDSASLEGPLWRQIDEAVAFVARNLKVKTEVGAAGRLERPELPLVAVREAVANAVAHRDYRSTAPIQLVLTDQTLIVWNPGHFPPPITAALLRERHPSVPTNPLIARALYLAGYIEEWGTGSLRIIEAMVANGNPAPIFEGGAEEGVRVTLPLVAPVDPKSERARAALKRLKHGKTFTSRDYASAARVSVRTAGLDLKGLEGQGLVKRVGVGRATRWVLT
jgi:ATP-dependent DNA helicase RecG